MHRTPFLKLGSMKHWFYSTLFMMFVIQATFCPTAWPLGKNPTPSNEKTGEDQLLERIDFGNSYIRGQTIQSGAVYLLQRKKSDIESLLKPRESYREEILKDFHIQEEPPEPINVIDLKTQ